MKLTFLGAAHEVTGSCFLLEACGKNILVDCGMEQGPDIYQNEELPVSASEIDCVFLTHAHIDHSGNLPLLYSHGFRGDIYSTVASADLCGLMLRDSAHIQEFEAEWRNRKAARAGKEPYIPLYTMEDAEGAIKLFIPCEYEKQIDVFNGISIRFNDAGHLLGSSSVEVWVNEGDASKKLVFSGDIGNTNQPIIKNPDYIDSADYVIMESTYGDRTHGEVPDYLNEIAELIQQTFKRGGNVVIPSFAVGRTQEILYFIRKIKEEGMVKGFDNFPVYVDSPLAIEATQVFSKNYLTCFDDETMAIINSGINPLSFPGLRLATTSDESRAINFEQSPKVIISASGMCEAGRIRHHLKHNLWRSESTVLFVGYQAVGTLGRSLLEGAKTVKLFGETIEVHAKIHFLSGVSGHADNEGLMKWASAFTKRPQQYFVVHGEDGVCDIFADRLKNELEAEACAPYSGDCFDLAAGRFISYGERKKIEKKTQTTTSPVFARLLAAGNRMLSLIKKSDGMSNKDLAKLTDQLNSLADKWEK